jgi:putative chitinase
MVMNVWKAAIGRMAPHADPKIVAMVADHADSVFRDKGIISMRRQASILAHMCIESAYFRELQENLNYSAPRLEQVWPARFPNSTMAAAYAYDPKKLANKVYNGRMGNVPGTDDGWNFRGKGLLQLTGRDNVTRLANRLGITPELCAQWLIDPHHALECAAEIYNMLGIGPFADRDDMRGQTKRLNGGYNGLAERQNAYNKAMRVLAQYAAPTIIGQHSEDPSSDQQMDEITADKLRANNSKTVVAADNVKGAALGVMGAATAASSAISSANETVTQVQSIAESVKQGKTLLSVASEHWQLIVIFLSLIFMGFFAWLAWRNANKAIEARVQDARTGANLSR